MAKGGVYNNGLMAGILENAANDQYIFTYTNDYFMNRDMPAISLSFPKTKKQYEIADLSNPSEQ